MADDITLNAGSAGATLAADDISGVHHQRVKVQYGADGSATDVSDTNPLPIDDAGGSLTVDWNGTAPPIGAGTEAAALRVTVATDSTGTLATQATLQAGSATVGEVTIGAATTAAGDLAKAEDAAHSSGDVGVMSLGVRNDTLAALAGTDGDYAPLQVDASGALYIQEGSALDVSAATVTVAGTVDLGVTDNGVLDNIQTNTVDIPNTIGTDGSAGPTKVLSVGGTESGGNIQELRVDSDGHLQIDIDGALPAGTNAIGKLAANDGVDIGDVDVATIAAGANLIGDVGISGARTSGGTTIYKNIDVDESEDEVKGSAGQLYWVHAVNLASTKTYLKIYDDIATNVTVGTTVPDLTFPLPTQGDSNGAGFVLSIPNGIAMGTGITIAATTGIADNDSGAPGANEVIVNLGFA